MPSNFCPSCGAPRKPGIRFCGGCGAALDGSPSTAPGLSASPPATSLGQAAGGWHVAVGDQLPTFAPVAVAAVSGTAAAASAPAAKPQGASIRGSVMQLLMVTGTDVAAAYATREPAAMKLANVRAGLAVVTAVAGLISGRSRGFFAKITMLSSLGLAVAQSPSLLDFGRRIAANPSLLGGLLPNAATQGLSFLAALRTAWAVRK